MDNHKPNNGANVGGNDLFGRGAGKGARQAGRDAGNLGEKGLKGLAKHRHPVKGAEKNAGRIGNAAGMAGQGAGKGLNAAGKGTQAAGKALGAIPYVGPAIGGAVGGLGKGMSAGGKGLDKGSKQLRNFSKKLKRRGKRGKFAKLAAWSSVHLFGLVGCFMVLLLIVGALVGAEMFMEDDEGSECSGGSTGPSVELSGNNNMEKVFNFLVESEHFSDAGAAGAVGRGMTESGLNPKADNPAGQVGGLFQWGYGGGNGSRLFSGGFVKSSKSTWTLPNEMKLTGYELHHSYSSVASKMRHMSSPTDAASYWTDAYEQAPGQAEGQAESNARQVYAKLNGKADTSDASDTASSAGSSCGSSTTTGGLSGVVAYAKKWLHKLPYSNGDRDAGAEAVAKGHLSDSSAGADCASFTWGVYKHLGYRVTPQPWAGNIYPPCKQISKSQAQPGDMAILGNKNSGDNGHVMILLTKWYGENNKTKVIDEGGDGSDVNISGFHDACASILYQPLHLVAPVKA